MATEAEASSTGQLVSDTDALPFCNLPEDRLDADGCVPSDLMEQLELTTCQLRPDTCFAMEAPPVLKSLRLPKLPKRVVAPKKKVTVMAEKHDSVDLPLPLPMGVEDDAAPLPQPPTPVATVGVPDTALGDIQKLIPAGGDANMITVMLAVVGVAGGGAAFKFYRSWQKSRHEQEMKKLEIEEKRAEKQDDKHEACNVARAALEARVASLEGQLTNTVAALEQKIAEAQKAASNTPVALGDFDPEELEDRLKKDEDRLKKLEKALKPAPAPKKR